MEGSPGGLRSDADCLRACCNVQRIRLIDSVLQSRIAISDLDLHRSERGGRAFHFRSIRGKSGISCNGGFRCLWYPLEAHKCGRGSIPTITNNLIRKSTILEASCDLLRASSSPGYRRRSGEWIDLDSRYGARDGSNHLRDMIEAHCDCLSPELIERHVGESLDAKGFTS